MSPRAALFALACSILIACSSETPLDLPAGRVTSSPFGEDDQGAARERNPDAPFLDEGEALAEGRALGIGSVILEGPIAVEARSLQNWTLVYRVGPAGIRPGGGIRVALRHLQDFSPPQSDDPTGEGFVRVETSGGKPVELHFEPPYGGELFNETFPWQNLLQITLPSEPLAEGEEIRVHYGDPHKGSRGMRVQSFDEEEFTFKVYVNALADGRYLPLAGSPSIEVLASAPHRVQVVMPSDALVGKPTWAIIRVEDRYGNPTAQFSGTARLSSTDATARLPERVEFIEADNGVQRVENIRFGRPGDFRISAHSEIGSHTGNPVRVGLQPPEQLLLWGDLHGHTLYSDGRGSVDAFYDFARNTAGLDFCAVTDHAFEVTDAQWAHSKKVTDAWYRPGEFVTLQAYEWSGMTELGGDHNVFFLEHDPPIFRSRSYYDVRNLEMYHGIEPQPEHIDDLFRRLEGISDGGDVFAIPHWGGRRANPEFHHPEIQRMVEIFSEHRRSPEWAMQFLQNGQRLGIMASTDGHYGNPGYGFLRPARGDLPQEVGHAAVAVYAAGRTRESLFRALYERRTYATSGDRILLAFDVDGHPMGSEFVSEAAPLIEVEVVGTAAIERVDVTKNTRVVHRVAGGDRESLKFRWTDPNFEPGDSAFYFVRALQVDGEEAVSSPVWISPPLPATAAAAAAAAAADTRPHPQI